MFGFEQRGVYVYDPFLHHPTRLSTLLLAVAIFALVVWRRRDPILGLMVVAAWVTVFELAYSLVGYLLRHDLWLRIYPHLDASSFWWVMIGLFGWAWLAHVKGARPELITLLVAVAIFTLWMAFGHGGNQPDQPIDWREEALNVSAKTLTGVSYLIGSLGTVTLLRGGSCRATSICAHFGILGVSRLRTKLSRERT